MRNSPQAVALGVFDYLLKPIDYDELTDILKKAIVHRKELISGEKARAVMSGLSNRVAGNDPSETAIVKTVEKVKTYILDNISDETLSCQTVAQHVYLNHDYLSRIFKA